MSKTYDPAKVVAVFGPIPISGYADGTFIRIEHAEGDYGLTVGADGESCRNKINNDSARIIFTILQSSSTNDALSAFRIAAKAGTGPSFAAFSLADLSGTSISMAEKSWIEKVPDSEFAKEVGGRDWAVATGKLVEHIGGNL